VPHIENGHGILGGPIDRSTTCFRSCAAMAACAGRPRPRL
jgi:hypothetical protein